MTSEHVFREDGNGGLAFVGQFEHLYESEDDPWEQSGKTGDYAAYYAFSRGQAVHAVQRHVGRGAGVELGCGHGHLTAALNALPGVTCAGLDVSEAAVVKARGFHPGVHFLVDDATKPHPAMHRFDFVLLAQCWWYVMHAHMTVIDNCIGHLRSGGVLVVSQGFLKGPQRYGGEIAEGWSGALKLFMDYPLTLIEAHYDDSNTHPLHDGLMVFRPRRHAQ